MALPPLPNNGEYTLTDKVFEALKEGILSLQIKPREYLVIGDVAKHYGISRTPVREALIRLEQEGWLKSDGRRGAQVTTPSAKTILELIEIQGVLEGYVARRAAQLMTDDDLRAAEDILNRADEAIANGDHKRSRELGDAFHQFLADKVDNQRLHKTVKQITEHVDRVRPLIWRHGAAPVEQSAQHHRAIFGAIKTKDARRAEEMMFHHTVWFEEELAATLEQVLG